MLDAETRKELEEAFLLEMAIPADKAKEICKGISFQFLIHIAKCFLFKDTKWYSHWLTECTTFCIHLDDINLKPKAKHPSKQFFLQYFVEKIANAKDAKLYLDDAIIKCSEIDRDECTNEEAFRFLDLWNNLRESIAESLAANELFDRAHYYNLIDDAIKDSWK